LKVAITSSVEQMATKRFNPKCSLRLHRRINPEQEGLFLKDLSVRFPSSRLGFLVNLSNSLRNALFDLPELASRLAGTHKRRRHSVPSVARPWFNNPRSTHS